MKNLRIFLGVFPLNLVGKDGGGGGEMSIGERVRERERFCKNEWWGTSGVGGAHVGLKKN